MKEEEGTGNRYEISHQQINCCFDTLLTVNYHVPQANVQKRITSLSNSERYGQSRTLAVSKYFLHSTSRGKILWQTDTLKNSVILSSKLSADSKFTASANYRRHFIRKMVTFLLPIRSENSRRISCQREGASQPYQSLNTRLSFR